MQRGAGSGDWQMGESLRASGGELQGLERSTKRKGLERGCEAKWEEQQTGQVTP